MTDTSGRQGQTGRVAADRGAAAPAGPARAALRSQIAVFSKRVRDVMRPTVMTTAADTPVRQVIADMAAGERSSAVVVDAGGRAVGILTERDVTRRVALSEDRGASVGAFATRPVHTVSADEYLYRVLARMRRLNLRHMPVVDAQARPIGIVNFIDAVAGAADQMLRQLERLTRERTLEGMAEVKAAQVEIARELLADNLPAPDIQGLITRVNRDIHIQVLDAAVRTLAEAGWGDPPVPFTLLIMGSGGRGENFLFPDQDNGFILADYPDDEHGRIDPYFIALAERFNTDLDKVGFPLCRGHVMARNPVWRKTLAQWREQVTLWARRRSPVAILFADIFFDFRPVAGPREPGEELRRHVTDALQAYPALLSMMAQDDTNKSVALGFFGRLLTDHSGQSPGRTDLKMRGTMPLVASVRLWALKHGVAETGTLQRLSALAARGVVGRDDHDELTTAFNRVTLFLLRQQLEDFSAGRKVGNFVDIKLLSRREKDELRHALRSIERFRQETQAMFNRSVF